MEKAVMVVDVLRPSLPSLVSLVPSLVLGSKTIPPVGSNRRGAVMNQPQSFKLAVAASEYSPYSLNQSWRGKRAAFFESGTTGPFFGRRSHASGRSGRSS